MAKDELVYIQTLDDLKKLAKKMKSAYARDQTEYIAGTPNAEDVLDKMSDEAIEEMVNCNSTQAILWNHGIFSLVCTENEQDDFRWHLSVCKVVGPSKLGPINEEEAEFIMSGFFEEWQEIKSPSKMSAVRHFTGD